MSAADLTRTLEQVAENLDAEGGIVQQESDRVKLLIADAVALMTDSFNTMHRIVQDQTALSAEIFEPKCAQTDHAPLIAEIQAAQAMITRVVGEMQQLMTRLASQDDATVLIARSIQQRQADHATVLQLNELLETAASHADSEELAQARALSQKLSESLAQELQPLEHYLVNEPDAAAQGDLSKLSQATIDIEHSMDEISKHAVQISERFIALDELGGAMSTSVQNAVRSLQFEDIASQALTSLTYNATSLAQLAVALRKLSNDQGVIDLDALAELEALCLKVLTELQERNANRTVSQCSMDEGDIELF